MKLIKLLNAIYHLMIMEKIDNFNLIYILKRTIIIFIIRRLFIKYMILDFGKSIFEYENCNLKYNQIQITNEPFFLSQDIYTAAFNIERPSIIDRNVSININVKTRKAIFNFSEVERITYSKNRELEERDISFKYNSDNYISFDLFVEDHSNYTIRKICRKPCIYCKKYNNYILEVDCHILNSEPIRSNTPDIYFIFDKHYIALYNSTYKTNNKDTISTLTITLNGESQSEVQELIFYHYIAPTNIDGPRYINRQNDIFQLNLSKRKIYISI